MYATPPSGSEKPRKNCTRAWPPTACTLTSSGHVGRRLWAARNVLAVTPEPEPEGTAAPLATTVQTGSRRSSGALLLMLTVIPLAALMRPTTDLLSSADGS